jgi:CheY-like chemotaxis protein
MPKRPLPASPEVLIVEDDEDIREVLAECVRDSGHGVAAVSNGKEALKLLAGSRLVPNLIVLDLSMPIMDGWELLEVLRTYKRLAEVPVIVVSAKAPGRATTYSNVTFLRKPVELPVLQATLEKYLP